MKTTTTQERWAFFSPWTALLREHKVRVKTQFLNHHSCRDTFKAIELELQPSVMEDYAAAPAQQQALVEALELVATALRLLPEAWGALLVDQCGCHWFKPELYDQETLAPRFELECSFYPGEILVAKTAMRLFAMLLAGSSTRTEAFETAKQHLMAMAGGDARVNAPVPLTISVSTWNELPSSFLLGHATFVEELKRFRLSDSPSWCSVEAVELDVTGPGVSSEAVKQCFRLASDPSLVRFTRLTLDPNDIGCSPRELVQLISTLVSTTPAMHLHLGAVGPSIDSSVSDNHFPDSGYPRHSSDKIIRMMEAIAMAPVSIQSLTIGRLESRESRGRGRSVSVWSCLLRTVFHPSASCVVERLELSSEDVLPVESGEPVDNDLATSTTQSHKIPPSLTLRGTSTKTSSLCPIIRTIGSRLHHLRISSWDRHNDPVPAQLILEACSNLKHLDLNSVALDSLDPFCTSPRRLSSLALTNIILHSRASLGNFLVKMADPPPGLGRELGEIVLSTQDASLLGPRELAQAAQVLQQNGRVHCLQLEVDSSTPESLLRRVAREHGLPAAVRVAPLDLSSKLASISALTCQEGPRDRPAHSRLCRDVLPLIFEFTAECMPRWVRVTARVA